MTTTTTSTMSSGTAAGTGSYGDITSTLNIDIMRSVTKYQNMRAQLVKDMKDANASGSGVTPQQRLATVTQVKDLLAALENQHRALLRQTKAHQARYNSNQTLQSTDRIQNDLQREVADKNERVASARGLVDELRRLVRRQRIFTYFYILWIVLAAAAFVYMFFVTKSVHGKMNVPSPLFQTSAAELRAEGVAWTSTRG